MTGPGRPAGPCSGPHTAGNRYRAMRPGPTPAAPSPGGRSSAGRPRRVHPQPLPAGQAGARLQRRVPRVPSHRCPWRQRQVPRRPLPRRISPRERQRRVPREWFPPRVPRASETPTRLPPTLPGQALGWPPRRPVRVPGRRGCRLLRAAWTGSPSRHRWHWPCRPGSWYSLPATGQASRSSPVTPPRVRESARVGRCVWQSPLSLMAGHVRGVNADSKASTRPCP